MNLAELNNLLNSELTSKIKESKEENGELLINVDLANIYSTILFLKTDSKCKFRQLIDILAVDFPGEDDRFKIYYLLLSHENNIRIKIVVKFKLIAKFPQLLKFIHLQIGWKEKYLTCTELNLKIIQI